MNLYYTDENVTLYNGSMLDVLDELPGNSVDSIVTDPPYELGFMNKSWDNSGIAFQPETWRKCYSVLKPGGYLLAFGGSRTAHRIACAIEDAGFEIRDTIMWLYGSGFPHSLNLGKAIESKVLNGSANTVDFKRLTGTTVEVGDWGWNKAAYEHGYKPSDYAADGHFRIDKVEYQTEQGKAWNGYGTALKPAYEPIIVARKPCDGTCVDNVLKWGVGGLNIDGCRVEALDQDDLSKNWERKQSTCDNVVNVMTQKDIDLRPYATDGRFPANVILTYNDEDQDEVCGAMPNTKGTSGEYDFGGSGNENPSHFMTNIKSGRHFDDEGSAARYFYCAKATKRDRDEGCSELADGLLRRMRPDKDDDHPTGLNKEGRFAPVVRKNTHPTVKPTALMQYLIRLVTPLGGTILDPFMGSGSTGKAAMYENVDNGADYKFIGIELTDEYLPIACARILFAKNGGVPVEVEVKDTEYTLLDYLDDLT